MFLNIAALPVLTITIRKNLMKLVAPHLIPKDNLQITLPTALFTLIIILPCATLAICNSFSFIQKCYNIKLK